MTRKELQAWLLTVNDDEYETAKQRELQSEQSTVEYYMTF
jgi:hypothetical protein